MLINVLFLYNWYFFFKVVLTCMLEMNGNKKVDPVVI